VGDANRAYAAVVGWAAAAITATLLNCGSVAAAHTINAGSWRPTLSLEPATSEPDPAPVSQTVGGRFQVTAREWFSGVSKVEAYNHAVASNVMMLHGGSIAYGWDNGYAVALSAYYGLGYGNFFDTFSEGITYLERLDVEAVLKVPLGTLPAYVHSEFGMSNSRETTPRRHTGVTWIMHGGWTTSIISPRLVLAAWSGSMSRERSIACSAG